MEYLMTYGWAILIILIAVGALFYLGVFDPSTPNTCFIEAPFVCGDVKIADNGVLLSLKQNNVETYTIIDMKVNGVSCEDLFNNEEITSNEQEIYCILGEGNNLDKNAKASITFDVEYSAKTGLEHIKTGQGSGQNENQIMVLMEGEGEQIGAIFVEEYEDYNCKELLNYFPYLEDGIYTIDPDGEGEIEPFDVYCDMTNGGWTVLESCLAFSNVGLDGLEGNPQGAPDVIGSGDYMIDPDGVGELDPYLQWCDLRVYFILNNQPNQDGNLLDSSTWVVESTGSQPGFSQNGATSENSIELGINPYGEEVALWKGGNDAESNGDGGWNTAIFTVDPSKTYRYTYWVKKIIRSGTTYFGLQSNVGRLDGGTQSNPYFWCGQVPQADRWYLIVGYIRPSDTTVETGGIGGVYDGVTKTKVISFTSTTGNCYSDYKHLQGDTTQQHRAYLFYDTNINNRQWFYDPRVEVEESLN